MKNARAFLDWERGQTCPPSSDLTANGGQGILEVEMNMLWTVIILFALVNGDFADGLAHWNAGAGWSAVNGTAVVELDNRQSDGINSLGSVMCSDPLPVSRNARVRGAASVREKDKDAGYLVPGVRWYNTAGARMGDYAFGYDHHANNKWVRVEFDTVAPPGARKVAFCFFAAAYAGEKYGAQVDNASLK